MSLSRITIMVSALVAATATGFAGAEDAPPGRIRGTIAAIDGEAVVVEKADGAKVTVRLASGAKIMVAVKASLADVAPGTYVGMANTGPNGLQDALEVHIFPEAPRGADEGQLPWDLGRHSRMTNGIAGTRVEAYDGQNVTLTYKGGESTIQVRPNTPVIRLQPGATRDLRPGAGLFVRAGAPQADGSVLTDSVIVGRDGAKPSM